MTAAATLPLDSAEIRDVLWRGAMYELLADAFSYPEPEILESLREGLDDLLRHEATSMAGLEPVLAILAERAATTAATDLVAVHTALFAGEVPCSACETEYDFDTFAKARQLADIAGFYRAFGLRVAETRPAPPDIIATELEFMSHLALKQAYAAANGMADQVGICADAERAFLEDHLGRWVPAFCRDLGRFGGEGFHAAAAAVCDRFILYEVERLAVHPHAPLGRKSQALEAEAFTCGLAVTDGTSTEEQP